MDDLEEDFKNWKNENNIDVVIIITIYNSLIFSFFKWKF